MNKCVVIGLDDYNSILSHLKSARIDLANIPQSYHQSEVDRHLMHIQTILTEEDNHD